MSYEGNAKNCLMTADEKSDIWLFGSTVVWFLMAKAAVYAILALVAAVDSIADDMRCR
jgi:hypothetical protein